MEEKAGMDYEGGDAGFQWTASGHETRSVCALGGPTGPICVRAPATSTALGGRVLFVGALVPSDAARAAGWTNMQAFRQYIDRRSQWTLYGYDDNMVQVQMARARANLGIEPFDGEEVQEVTTGNRFTLSIPYSMDPSGPIPSY